MSKVSSRIPRDINSMWTRLFDHRGFLTGEIQYFLREFEEKRNDREVESLFSILVNNTDIKDTKLDKIKQLGETVLPNVQESLNTSLQICEDIAIIERKYKETDTLQESRNKRKIELQNFMDVMSDTCKRIDNAFEQKEEELQEFYIDLERKLNLTPSPRI